VTSSCEFYKLFINKYWLPFVRTLSKLKTMSIHY
jgi:hypothetical protein